MSRVNSLIIVDLEATCADDNSIKRSDSETIQIGACLVSGDGCRISSFSTFIRPVIYPQLTEFCTSLTGITQSQVDSAPIFEEALDQFDQWILQYWDVHGGQWGSWGAYDRNQFDRDIDRNHLSSYVPAMNHINLKQAFAKTRGVKQMGLAGALKLEGLGFIGRHHNGLDDAVNIGRLRTVHRIIREGIEQWPSSVTVGRE